MFEVLLCFILTQDNQCRQTTNEHTNQYGEGQQILFVVLRMSHADDGTCLFSSHRWAYGVLLRTVATGYQFQFDLCWPGFLVRVR